MAENTVYGEPQNEAQQRLLDTISWFLEEIARRKTEAEAATARFEAAGTLGTAEAKGWADAAVADLFAPANVQFTDVLPAMESIVHDFLTAQAGAGEGVVVMGPQDIVHLCMTAFGLGVKMTADAQDVTA